MDELGATPDSERYVPDANATDRRPQTASSELLAQLSSGIAHDFNDLLTAIRGHLELSAEHATRPAELARSLSIALACVERATVLNRRLVELCRLPVIRPGTVNAEALIRGLEPFLRKLLPDRVRLELDVDGTISSIAGDRLQIEQAITNLALNAMHAIEGSGTIVIRAREEMPAEEFLERHRWCRPGRYLRLEVEDDGPGLPPDLHRNLFRPLAANRPDRPTPGLSVVYSVVKRHRGYVGVESEPGRGTRFWILLPLPGKQAAPTEEADRRETRPAPAANRGAILVVDDEQVVRELTARVLADRGYDVHVAASAEAARELFCQRPEGFDLLFTDLALAGTSGQQLAAELRTRQPSLRVIFTSGYDRSQFAGIDALADQDPFLEKPYSLKFLAQVIDEAISDSSR